MTEVCPECGTTISFDKWDNIECPNCKRIGWYQTYYVFSDPEDPTSEILSEENMIDWAYEYFNYTGAIGSSFDSFLNEYGLLEICTREALMKLRYR